MKLISTFEILIFVSELNYTKAIFSGPMISADQRELKGNFSREHKSIS